MHPGDNYADQSAAGSASLFSGRNRQLRTTVDHMLGEWDGRDRLDPERVGAFGLSAGALTVLTAVGAQPDLRIVATHCAESPEFVCDVLRHAQSMTRRRRWSQTLYPPTAESRRWSWPHRGSPWSPADYTGSDGI
jgi:predicted dienelactone hydrolase